MNRIYLAASVSALLVATSAHAQDGPGLTQAAPIAVEDEIIVTATRRAQSIQDVPIAVAAYSGEQLERQGIRDITSLESVSPNFNLSTAQTTSGSTTLRVRGVGTTGDNLGLESAVGVFLDGVYLSRPAVALGDLVDLEQLELLRGPQGTLFGRNTSAGALNITTKKPSLDAFDAFANLTVGNEGLVSLQGGFTVPLVEDMLGLRLSAASTDRDGYVRSLTGAESGSRDRVSVRGQLLFAPTDAVELRVIADYADAQDDCCDAIILQETPFAPLYGLAGIAEPGGGVQAVGPDALEDMTSNSDFFTNPTEQGGLSAQLDWDLGAANLTYIAAWRDFNALSDQDSDFTNAEVFRLRSETSIETITQEVRLQGEALDGRLDWLVGAYYSDEDLGQDQTIRLGEDFQPYLDAIAIGALGGPSNPLGLRPFSILSAGAQFEGNNASNRFTQTGESVSVFTHNVFDVTDRLSATLGLRYVDETKDGAFAQSAAQSDGCFGIVGNLANIPADLQPLGIGLGCFPFVVVADSPVSAVLPLPRTFSETFEDDELVYTAKLAYELSPELNAYAGITHGFKSGGFNLDPTAAIGGSSPQFASEEVDAYEIGLKFNMPGQGALGRVRGSLVGFHQDISDFQVVNFTGTQFVTFNVDQALSTGVELELQTRIADRLLFNAGGAYTDARYPDDCAGDSTAAQVLSLCGNPLTNASEWSGVLGLTWEDSLSDSLGYFLNANLRYESERRTYTQAVQETGLPSAFDFQEGNVKLNLRGGLTSDHWSLEAWSTNITDERTRTITFNLPLRGLSSTGSSAVGTFVQDPRFYGATLRWKY